MLFDTIVDMKANITHTIETELLVTRDAQLDKDYLRIQARKARREALRREVAKLYAQTLEAAENGWNEFTTPIKLDYLDWKYGTHMRSQWFSGKRTQQILKAKRDFGLM